MAAKNDYLEAKILDDIFRTADTLRPSGIWIALYISATGDDGSGTEVTGGSYARVNVPQNDTEWTDPSVGGNGAIENVNAIVFPQATASWGTILDVGIMDASTGPNMLYHGPLTQNRPVNSGDTFQFDVGDLDITEA